MSFDPDFRLFQTLFLLPLYCKNQVPNRQKIKFKIKFKNPFCEIEILKNQVQIDRGTVSNTVHKLSHAEAKGRQKNAELSNSPVNTRN